MCIQLVFRRKWCFCIQDSDSDGCSPLCKLPDGTCDIELNDQIKNKQQIVLCVVKYASSV